MSSVRSSETRLQTLQLSAAASTLSDTARDAHAAVLRGMCSRDVLALAPELADDALPVWERIEAVLPGWEQTLPAPATDALAAARRGSIPLHDALGAVAETLAAQERTLVADVSYDALVADGYHVTRADGVHTSALDARRGHETLLVVIDAHGEVTTDHAGLADATCDDRHQDYVDAMAARGVLLEQRTSVEHGDPRGGDPIRAAVRAGGEHLAAGAVRHGDAHATPLLSPLLHARASARTTARERAS